MKIQFWQIFSKNDSEQSLFSGPNLEDIGNLQNYMASLEEREIHEIMNSWTVCNSRNFAFPLEKREIHEIITLFGRNFWLTLWKNVKFTKSLPLGLFVIHL